MLDVHGNIVLWGIGGVSGERAGVLSHPFSQKTRERMGHPNVVVERRIGLEAVAQGELHSAALG
jgi:hypothetical protein